jgi:hypothetical protein
MQLAKAIEVRIVSSIVYFNFFVNELGKLHFAER